MNESQLVRLIKEHIAKGDKAAEKSEQHYIAAGQHLKTLKAEHGGTWAEWEALLKERVGIGKSRASELMQIADGRKTVEQVQANSANRKAKAIQCSPLRSGESAPDSEEAADARKAHYAALEEQLPCLPPEQRGPKLASIPDVVAEAVELVRYMSCEQWQRFCYLIDQIERLPVKGTPDGDAVIAAGRLQIEGVGTPEASAEAMKAKFAALDDDGLDIPESLRRAPKAAAS